MNRLILVAGALLAATGVLLGAFGAHGLRDMLGSERLGWWHTAVQYQFWHAIGLIALAPLGLPRIRLVAGLLVAGTVIFAGSLYLMALTDWRWLGMITPLGGILLVAGWILLACSALRFRDGAS
jgi:uncharacterized membrane protein YgdD (TMEM256/DUF423 family)